MAEMKLEVEKPNEYPKWVYHRTEAAKVVQTPEEKEALGPGWMDSPAEVKEVKEAPKAWKAKG